MIRLGSIILLSISVIFMIKTVSDTWDNKPSFEQVFEEQKQDEAPIVVEENPVSTPQIQTTIPDLNIGYLFNEARLLEEKTEAGPSPSKDDLEGGDTGIKTDINSVTYSGSVITDSFRKAIVTYTAAPQPKTSVTDKKARSSRRKKRVVPRRTSKATLMLMEGELIGGYKVTAIAPDKIVFSKGEEVIEKNIYDQNKKRVISRAPSKVAKMPTRPRPTADPAGMAPPVRKTVAATPASTISKAKRPASTRKLVVSRKPAPKPDTSRVSRLRRSRGSSVRAPASK